MFLTNLFNFKRECTHSKIRPDIEFGYCPDCGKLIKNEWYITRCACCGNKLKTTYKNGVIQPQNNFCTNCGSNEYIVEKLPKINFIDINYAVLVRKEVENETILADSTQCWAERSIEQPRLTVQYL